MYGIEINISSCTVWKYILKSECPEVVTFNNTVQTYEIP